MANTTRRSLLTKVKHGDEISWAEFYETYTPLIYSIMSDRVSSQSDREDLCQEIFKSVFKSEFILKYSSDKGKFRTYFGTLVKRKITDYLRKKYSRPLEVKANITDNDMQDLDEELNSKWEREWKLHILEQSLKQVRSEVDIQTYQTFELYALNNHSPAEVANFLGVTVNQVYVYKNRVIKKLKKIIKELS